MQWLLSILTWFLSLFATREASKREGAAESEDKRIKEMLANIAKANEELRAAQKAHEDKTDDAFDKDFWR